MGYNQTNRSFNWLFGQSGAEAGAGTTGCRLIGRQVLSEGLSEMVIRRTRHKDKDVITKYSNINPTVFKLFCRTVTSDRRQVSAHCCLFFPHQCVYEQEVLRDLNPDKERFL